MDKTQNNSKNVIGNHKHGFKFDCGYKLVNLLCVCVTKKENIRNRFVQQTKRNLLQCKYIDRKYASIVQTLYLAIRKVKRKRHTKQQL